MKLNELIQKGYNIDNIEIDRQNTDLLECILNVFKEDDEGNFIQFYLPISLKCESIVVKITNLEVSPSGSSEYILLTDDATIEDAEQIVTKLK